MGSIIARNTATWLCVCATWCITGVKGSSVATTGAEEGSAVEHERVVTYAVADANDPILFISFTLLTGAVVQLILNRLPSHYPKPPYTVVLFLIGMGMGALTSYDHLDTLSHATNGMANMDPHLILHVFLPPLLFESAFGMTPHVFAKCFPQAVILAIPGVMVATGLTGVLCHAWFDYEWSWTLAFMFGAMVSATDPVAVVALLTELNAPKPLSTVIEAESLMNDGSAFVLFLILQDFAKGKETDAADVIETTLKMAVGGPILGILFGYLFNTLLLRFCINDPTVEISLTVTSAYMAFWTAEYEEVKSSGVLTVVFLGVYMGAFGKQNISPEIHEYLHHVWHFLSHVANTIIFVLSGAFTYNLVSNEHIELTDWGYLLVLYIIVHVTRAVTIITMWPAISKLGYGMSVPRGIVLWYGGLRGAVGLVLALLVSHEEGIEEIDRARIQFLVAGLVAMTIGINGTTASFLYTKLGLAESTKGHSATLKLSVDYVESNSDTLADKMKSLDFWGNLVQKDIQREVEQLTTYRPHKATGGKVTEANYTEVERMKRMVVTWFDSQPENAGRRVERVSCAVKVSETSFTSCFTHMPELGGVWPPPLQPNIKSKDARTTEFLIFTTVDGTIDSAKPYHPDTVDTHGKLGRLEKKKLFWYPDFSHILSKHKPSGFQKLFEEDKEERLLKRPLLHDVREDLRRIIIVSVQHHYEQWSEKRIIRPDVYGILEEATLFVEDEDHLWVSSTGYAWEVRGRYDLKSEFSRILEAVGLCKGGPLGFAMEPVNESEDVVDYWAGRKDIVGRIQAVGFKGLEMIFGEDSVTRAYLHHKLRLALHALMFYKAAHQQAWNNIQEMWGALLEGSDEVKTMQEEEDDLKWCYSKADEVIRRLAEVVPDTRGMIASVHEDFIHRLLVVQMTESTEHCVEAGLLTDADSQRMLRAIRNKLKPFFDNQLLGSPAKRMEHLVLRSRNEAYGDMKLPDWHTLEHMMHEMESTQIINKRTFWEIKFISDLQAMSTRDKHHNEADSVEEPLSFVMIDGEQRAGSIAQEQSPFCNVVLNKNRTIHMSVMSSDGDDSDLGLNDACCIRASKLPKFKETAEQWNLTRPLGANVDPSLIKQLLLSENSYNTARKGWVVDKREVNGRIEVLVFCSLVEKQHSLSWFPIRSMMRCPNFLYEDCLQKTNTRAKNRLQWCIRQIWFRSGVDRTRQQIQHKFPHLVSNQWQKAKLIHNEYIGTPWPWWGCVIQDEEIVYTEALDEDGEPDWDKEMPGVLLSPKVAVYVGYKALVRHKYTQVVVEIPVNCWKKAEELVLESHYGRLGLLPSSSYVPFVVGGTEYPTTDHYYQSSKYPDIKDDRREERLEYKRRIIEARTAAKATQLGQSRSGPPIAPNWDAIRDEYMMMGIRAKFTLHHGVNRHHEQLLSTGEKLLLAVDQGEVMFDRHWSLKANDEGVLEGENIYGKLLMLMRRELRIQIISEPFVAAAIAVLMVQISLRSNETIVAKGEHVLVRNSPNENWHQGVVTTVSPISGVVQVIVEGYPEMIWQHLQPALEVKTFCEACQKLVKGVSNTSVTCDCGEVVRLSAVTHFYSYKWMSLAPSSAVVPAMLLDNEKFNSTEHYYQAHKFPPSELRTAIINAPTHLQALKLGQDRTAKPPMRPDWEEPVKPDGLPPAYIKIIDALEEPLQDNMSAIYWGTGPNNTGLNMYGLLLMAARTELRQELAYRSVILAASVAAIKCYRASGQCEVDFATPQMFYVAAPIPSSTTPKRSPEELSLGDSPFVPTAFSPMRPES